jgi:hypothetical protein
MSLRVLGAGRWLLVILAGLLMALAAAALGRAPSPPRHPSRAASPAREGPVVGEASAIRPADPAGIRDVFRFVDETRPAARKEAAPTRVDGPPVASPPPGPRLVGLVRRAGRLMAALSVEGEVELAGQGDSAAGVTVLSVGEEGVRVRLPDGTEQDLPLP